MAASYAVRLAPAFSLDEGRGDIHALRYNFKPDGISHHQSGRLIADTSVKGVGNMHVELPSSTPIVSSYYYQGQQALVKPGECVLLWDNDQQAYVLHRLTTCTRLSKSKGALPALLQQSVDPPAAKRAKLSSSLPSSRVGTPEIPASCQASPDAIEELDLGRLSSPDEVPLAAASPLPAKAVTPPIVKPTPTAVQTTKPAAAKAKPRAKPKAKTPAKPKASTAAAARAAPAVIVDIPHYAPQRAVKGLPRSINSGSASPYMHGGGGKGRVPVPAPKATKKKKRRTDQIDMSSGESSSDSDIGGGGYSEGEEVEVVKTLGKPQNGSRSAAIVPKASIAVVDSSDADADGDGDDEDDWEFDGLERELDAHFQAIAEKQGAIEADPAAADSESESDSGSESD